MSNQSNEGGVARMNWQTVRQVLRKPKTRSEAMNPQERNLRDYFGDENFRETRE